MRQVTVLALAAGLSWLPLAQAQDVASAEALIKKSGCLKCHSVSADKDGPSFKKTAAKYKGQGDAAAKLQKFLTAGGKHPALKADEGQVKNVVAYVLSR
jgi:cytochrome c